MSAVVRFPALVFVSMLSAILWQSCCPACQKGSLGAYQIDARSEQWIGFANQTLTYENGSGEQLTIQFGVATRTFTPQSVDCTQPDNDQCAACCSQIESGAVIMIGQGVQFPITVNLFLEKDLIRYDALLGAANVLDRLQINISTGGESALCEILDLPTPANLSSVKINDRTFADVYTCQIPGTGTGADQLEAVYFQEENGLVGFSFRNDVSWNLMP